MQCACLKNDVYGVFTSTSLFYGTENFSQKWIIVSNKYNLPCLLGQLSHGFVFSFCKHGKAFPADTRRWTNVVLILGRRRGRWDNIKTTSCVQRLVSARSWVDTLHHGASNRVSARNVWEGGPKRVEGLGFPPPPPRRKKIQNFKFWCLKWPIWNEMTIKYGISFNFSC